jgi:hypothetical protein
MKNSTESDRWKKIASASAAVAFLGSLGYLAGSHLGNPRTAQTEAPNSPASTDLLSSLSPSGDSTRGGSAKSAKNEAPAASGVTGARVALLTAVGAPSGEVLPPAGQNPDADKGRVVKLDASRLKAWAQLKQGDALALPSPSGEELEGTVNLVQEDGAWLRMGGSLANGKGTFSLNTNFNDVSGMILLPQEGVGYQIQMDGPQLILVERRMSSLVCFPAPKTSGALAASDNVARQAVPAALVIPSINTRPGARGVIYVDFDGESVTDPVWNAGRTINAAPSALSSDQIALVLKNAAQDWAPFDVTLTTDAALYAATLPGLRMRAIVTPTDTAAPGSGGVAYVDSWSGAGKGFRSDVVCWIFNQSVKSVTEALSHEVGHTVGLNHDGQTGGSEYYSGHGGGLTTPTSWAPIMGAGYSKSLVQWSKGEYPNANNREDDLAIISKAANQFGFVKNEMLNGVKALPVSGSTFQAEGLLRAPGSVDTYKFRTAGGQLLASVSASNPESDVDVQLELQDANGGTVVLSDLPDALSASLNKAITAGDYSLIVRPSGKPVSSSNPGYSGYGSVGRYSLSGSLQGIISVPIFTSPSTMLGTAGQPLSYTVGVSAGSTVTVASSSRLPAGLSFNTQTLVLSGTPTQATGTGTPGAVDGPGLLSLVATNASGSATVDIVINISAAGLPLADALLGNTAVTSPAAPWTGVSMVKADGTNGTVAQSGAITNGGVTTLRFDYTYRKPANQTAASPTIVTFYWKASTEAMGSSISKGDIVQCRVDGALQRDWELGTPLILSGETGWVKQSVRLNGSGTRRVEFIYAKDASIAAGQDKVWVYVASIGQPPMVNKTPSSQKLAQGATSFTLSASISGADSLVWKKDYATLSDGTSSSGSTIVGATTSELKVSNITGADVGTYWLEAKNAYGKVITRPVEVVIAAPPVITQQPAAPVGLKVGDPLTLTASVSGGTPIYYQWVKDGAQGRWSVANSSSISLIVPKTTAASAGNYKLVVLNQFAVVSSDSVSVTLAPASASASTARVPSR